MGSTTVTVPAVPPKVALSEAALFQGSSTVPLYQEALLASQMPLPPEFALVGDQRRSAARPGACTPAAENRTAIATASELADRHSPARAPYVAGLCRTRAALQRPLANSDATTQAC